jgi:hypothetical protein
MVQFLLKNRGFDSGKKPYIYNFLFFRYLNKIN